MQNEKLVSSKALPAAGNVYHAANVVVIKPFGANTGEKASNCDGGHGSQCNKLTIG
jgi:hypothetical protein